MDDNRGPAPTPNVTADAFDWYVGIDGGGASHQVCVLDTAGAVVEERAVAHSGPALAALVARLHELAGPSLARVAVGIEQPHGGPVAACLEHGAAVFAINPKQLERFRERATAAGAKDDRRDAYTAAAALRTDRGVFHRVRPAPAALVELRELSRLHEELGTEVSRLSNRLRAQLERYFPQLLTLVPGADEAWLWALLSVAPTPAAAARWSERRLTGLLRAHRIRRFTGATLRAALRTPPLQVVPGTVAAASGHVAVLLPQLELVARQHRECAAALAAALDAMTAAAAPDGEPPVGEPPVGPPAAPAAPATPNDSAGEASMLGRVVQVLRSLPGVGVGVAGVFLAEAPAAVLAGDYRALRSHGGSAPVTRQSGKQRLVAMRYACNRRLRTALFHWARTSVMHDAAAARYYAVLRARGHTHARALRSVGDRWLRILAAMITTGQTYDPTRFVPRATS